MSETNSKQPETTNQKKWLSRFKSSLENSWNNFIISLIEWPIKRPIKFIILFLLVIYVLISLFNMKLINTFLNYSVSAAAIDLLFRGLNTIEEIFSSNGRFDWYALSAFIAGLTYLTNSAYNRKKFRADLISKSRIEWLQIVRNTMAEYLAKAQMYLFIYKEYFLESRDDDEVNLSRLNKYGEDLDRLQNKLYLYISDNKGNTELNTKIGNVTSYLNNLPKPAKSNNGFSNLETFTLKDNVIVELRACSREYIKNEWERAKRGK